MCREKVGGRGVIAEGGAAAAGEGLAGGGSSGGPSAHPNQRGAGSHAAPLGRVWGCRLPRATPPHLSACIQIQPCPYKEESLPKT